MFEELSSGQLVKIFALISFFSVVFGLFVYFLLFPVNCGKKDSSVIGVDPIAFEIAKAWNNNNLSVKTIDIDSCNKATRIDNTTWQVELKPC